MNNLSDEDFSVKREDRSMMNSHKSICVFFTGFSGSGKSTIANALEEYLNAKKIRTYCLDGDNIRKGINNDLTFSPEHRTENLRRIAEVTKLFIDAGIVTIASFVAPYEKDRNNLKRIIGIDDFFEIHVSTSIKVCEDRDVKGLYAKVRNGEIKNFTGITAPYEEPKTPDMRLDTEHDTVDELVLQVYEKIKSKINL